MHLMTTKIPDGENKLADYIISLVKRSFRSGTKPVCQRSKSAGDNDHVLTANRNPTAELFGWKKWHHFCQKCIKLHPHWHRHPHYHQLHINFKSPTMPYSTLPVSVRRFHFWQLLPWVASYVQRLFTFTISFWHVQILRSGERRSRDWWNSKVLGACLGGPLWKSAPKQRNDIEDVWSIFQMHMELAAGWFTLRTRYISISKLLGLVLGHKSRNTNVWGWHQNGMPSQGWFEFGLSVVKTCKILGWFWLRCTTWTRTQCDADQTNPWWKPKNCHILQGSSYMTNDQNGLMEQHFANLSGNAKPDTGPLFHATAHISS